MYIVWRPPPPPPPPTPTKAIVSAFNSEDECWRRFHRDNNISDHRPRTSLSLPIASKGRVQIHHEPFGGWAEPFADDNSGQSLVSVIESSVNHLVILVHWTSPQQCPYSHASTGVECIAYQSHWDTCSPGQDLQRRSVQRNEPRNDRVPSLGHQRFSSLMLPRYRYKWTSATHNYPLYACYVWITRGLWWTWST